MTNALIQVDHLTKKYGKVTALNDVSFTISDGITGILGENGAGKSTAIKILLGLLQPTSGSATILGQNALANLDVRSRIGYMPEHDCLPSQVSAAEFLTHMAEASGLPPTMARTRAADTLRHAGLFEERYRAIGGYSTGMKQRVKLCQALVHDPSVVFLDEPTAGLDPISSRVVKDKIAKERGRNRTFVLTSHVMSELEELADDIAFLIEGRIRFAGSIHDLKKMTRQLSLERAIAHVLETGEAA